MAAARLRLRHLTPQTHTHSPPRPPQESGFAGENEGWNYGINAYALTGAAAPAAAQLLQRAMTPPATGYRFPGFAPHEQDFDPSADHFANMNRALQVRRQGGAMRGG